MSEDWLGGIRVCIVVIVVPFLLFFCWCCCGCCRQKDHLNQNIQDVASQPDSSNEGFESADYEQIAQPEALNPTNNSTGASKGDIRRLPVVGVTHHMITASSNPNCTICLASFEISEAVRMLPCFHHFHPECIDTWLMEKSQCPTCKSAIVYTDEETELAVAA